MRVFSPFAASALAASLLLAALTPAQPQQTPTPAPAQGQQQQQQQPPLLPPQQSAAPRPSPAPPEGQPPTPVGQTIAEDEVVTVDTSLVNVLFNAVDRDRRFVTTLRREDVRVFENDTPQEITAFQRETNLPLSIAILVDVSTSQEVPLPDEKAAAVRFVNSIIRPDRDSVAVLSFAGTATVEQDLTDDTTALRSAVERVEIEPISTKDEYYEYQQGERAEVVPAKNELYGLPGSTAIWDAIWATSTELMAGAPSGARRAIILLSDGDDTSSRVKREEAVEAAVKANTTVYAIGFESFCDDCRFDKKALRRLSEETGGRAFFPENLQELNAAFGQIQQELRTQYLLSYSPANKARDGSFRRIRVEVTNPDLQKQKIKLSYREGYFATPPLARPAEPRERAPQEKLKRPPRRLKKK